MEEARAERREMARGIIQRAIARDEALKRGEAPSAEAVIPEGYFERMRGAPPAYA